MAKERILRSELHQGRFYKLMRPVGPIPAGIYRFEGWSDTSARFSVGKDRAFGFKLLNVERAHICEVSYAVGRTFATGASEFSIKYFKNIESLQDDNPILPASLRH